MFCWFQAYHIISNHIKSYQIISNHIKSYQIHIAFFLTPLWKLSEHFSFTLQLLRHSPNFHEIWTLDNLVFKMPLKSKREISYISDKINVIRVVKFLSWRYISVILAIYRIQLCPIYITSKYVFEIFKVSNSDA